MEREKTISQIIAEHYPEFSRMHLVLADFLRENMYQLPFMSINELSALSGVSPASITRFTRKLGLSGYAEFQQHARKQVQKDIVPFVSLKTTLQNSSPEELNSDSLLQDTITNTMRLLGALYSETLDTALRKAAHAALHARRVYVVGNRSTYAVAYYLFFMLHNMRDTVFMVTPGTGEASGYLCGLTSEDCLLAVSYRQYSRFSRDTMKFFKEKQCPVFLLTDDEVSVITEFADVVLPTKDAGGALLICAMTVVNAFITLFGKMDPVNTLAKLEEQDAIAIANDIYF